MTALLPKENGDTKTLEEKIADLESKIAEAEAASLKKCDYCSLDVEFNAQACVVCEGEAFTANNPDAEAELAKLKAQLEKKNDDKDLKNRTATRIADLKKKMEADKAAVVEYVERNGLVIRHLGDYQDDEKVVRAAVQNNGLALQFASASLKNKEGVVLAAIEDDADALLVAPLTMQLNVRVNLAAVKKNPFIVVSPFFPRGMEFEGLAWATAVAEIPGLLQTPSVKKDRVLKKRIEQLLGVTEIQGNDQQSRVKRQEKAREYLKNNSPK